MAALISSVSRAAADSAAGVPAIPSGLPTTKSVGGYHQLHEGSPISPELDADLSSQHPSKSDWVSDKKQSVRQVLDEPESSYTAAAVHGLMFLLILGSTMCAVLETVPEFNDRYEEVFSVLEKVFTFAFTLEIVVRMMSEIDGCHMYFFHVANVVDVLATLPWYMETAIVLHEAMSSPGDHSAHSNKTVKTLRMVRLVRMVRLLRVLRLAKIARNSEMIAVVVESIWDSLEGVVVLVVFVGMGALIAAAAVFAVESDEGEGKFTSIPQSLWWSMATITTVGYGDVVPSTEVGKAVACFTMMGGTVIVSVCVAVITTSFTESYQKRKMLKQARHRRSHHLTKMKGAVGQEPLERRESTSSYAGSPLTDRGAMDPLHTFVSLEEETKAALHRLEAIILHLKAEQAQSGAGKEGLPDHQSSMEYASLNMEVLLDQGKTFFKAASHLAEHVQQAEEHHILEARGLMHKRTSVIPLMPS